MGVPPVGKGARRFGDGRGKREVARVEGRRGAVVVEPRCGGAGRPGAARLPRQPGDTAVAAMAALLFAHLRAWYCFTKVNFSSVRATFLCVNSSFRIVSLNNYIEDIYLLALQLNKENL